ncbi:MAG TPA: NAD(P)(+) transhydrogenase (Re/Si-specific) subunit beta [Chromatiales bacterium]|nr:NAD(P)(+) transhydrogenase (Re/Si-specific) subunit beta [Chromatiales bacterium]
MELLIQGAYFLAAVLFIVGLKQMSSPVTARRGIVWAGVGMLVATLVTFLFPGLHNYVLMLVAMGVSSAIAWVWARKVAMTDMPQMIAIYNGMGGGSAATIAAVELVGVTVGGENLPFTVQALAVLGALIGTVAFSGSVIAFAKLQGLIRRSVRFGGQQVFNILVLVAALATGVAVVYGYDGAGLLAAFFALAFLFGIFMTLPIGGADMPVVISLYNALTGLAVGFEGFVLGNPAMMIAGTVVGASGSLLTQLMAKAMNRPLSNVLFSHFGTGVEGAQMETTGEMKPIDAQDAAIMMAYADKVIIVPGYGMAVAQAQHKVWELAKLLLDRGVDVKFAIHPVAGRMPGHMNVLLAEAGVPYDLIFDMDEINAEFPNTDVALVIGANDVVNPAAREDPNSPIYGMPILDVDKARNVIVIKRGRGAGFSGVENRLFFADNTRMLFGDGQKMAAELVNHIKELGG